MAWLCAVEQYVSGHILDLKSCALHIRAQLAAHADRADQPLQALDGPMMATAQYHRLTVAIRNEWDFSLLPHVFKLWGCSIAPDIRAETSAFWATRRHIRINLHDDVDNEL